MNQEWDFPPRRQSWREEVFARPGKRGRFDRVIDHEPRSKNLSQWYLKQMNGRGSWLYKLLITMLVGTLLLFIAGITAVTVVVIQASLGGL